MLRFFIVSRGKTVQARNGLSRNLIDRYNDLLRAIIFCGNNAIFAEKIQKITICKTATSSNS